MAYAPKNLPKKTIREAEKKSGSFRKVSKYLGDMIPTPSEIMKARSWRRFDDPFEDDDQKKKSLLRKRNQK